jgi:hypothetical protein
MDLYEQQNVNLLNTYMLLQLVTLFVENASEDSIWHHPWKKRVRERCFLANGLWRLYLPALCRTPTPARVTRWPLWTNIIYHTSHCNPEDLCCLACLAPLNSFFPPTGFGLERCLQP